MKEKALKLIEEKKYFEAIDVLYELLEKEPSEFCYVNLVRCFSEDYTLEKTYLIKSLIDEAKNINITDEAYLKYINQKIQSNCSKQDLRKAKECDKKIEKLSKKPQSDKWFKEVKELFESIQKDYEEELEYTKEIKNKEILDKMYDEYFNKFIDPFLTASNLRK